MSEIVLFHSVLGPRPGVRAFADRLTAAGHVVHLPDLYDGAVFDDYAEGDAFTRRLGGYPELLRRTESAVKHLPADLVYAGFSNGAASAEYLSVTRPGARGAVLMHGALPLGVFGPEAEWPGTVPVQLHYGREDPLRQESSVRSFSGDVLSSGAPFQYFEYPVAGHLFADPDLPDEYDADAADLMLSRVLEFLTNLG